MNKARRKRIGKVHEELDAIRERIQDLLDEEQDAYDALPESLQQGDKGDGMQTAIDGLQTAVDAIDDCKNGLDEAEGVGQ